MKTTNQNIVIPFVGLEDGNHIFDFDLCNAFFEQFEFSEVKEGKLSLIINLDKKPQFIVLQIQINGHVNIICDRCLECFDLNVNFSGPLYIKFGDEINQENPELMIIPESEDHLDLNHFIYECISLSLPYQRIHPKDENEESKCNKEMLEKIEEHKIEENEKEIDSRWDQLKNLKNFN